MQFFLTKIRFDIKRLFFDFFDQLKYKNNLTNDVDSSRSYRFLKFSFRFQYLIFFSAQSAKFIFLDKSTHSQANWDSKIPRQQKSYMKWFYNEMRIQKNCWMLRSNFDELQLADFKYLIQYFLMFHDCQLFWRIMTTLFDALP